MIAKDFKELRVYQMAFDSAMRIFELTKKFPAEERYSLIRIIHTPIKMTTVYQRG